LKKDEKVTEMTMVVMTTRETMTKKVMTRVKNMVEDDDGADGGDENVGGDGDDDDEDGDGNDDDSDRDYSRHICDGSELKKDKTDETDDKKDKTDKTDEQDKYWRERRD
jgi:hypothetical protein